MSANISFGVLFNKGECERKKQNDRIEDGRKAWEENTENGIKNGKNERKKECNIRTNWAKENKLTGFNFIFLNF